MKTITLKQKLLVVSSLFVLHSPILQAKNDLQTVKNDSFTTVFGLKTQQNITGSVTDEIGMPRSIQ
ncbi:hypothetical protein [Gillisia sp. JM1]|uniref:hypothetical protein n=1 Tax=Gillisia sp. JM1 TaxID=1283286 RepID=UPI0012DCB21D|nr:hypothetical protein [Gillisia sp. JM1]